MATPMAAMAFLGDPEAIEEVTEVIAKTSPLKGRPGLATDVAQAALWLALFVDKQPATLVTWKKILYTELTWPFQP